MFLNNPEYAKVGDKKYKINTDFRVAIECNNIAQDDSIGNTERPLAIIYKLFGDDGLDNPQDWEKLLELGIKYLSLGKDTSGIDKETEIDMDFNEDMDYIEASFMSDYNIDLANTKMHWYKFYKEQEEIYNIFLGKDGVKKLLNGRNLRWTTLSEIDELIKKQIAPQLNVTMDDITKKIKSKYSNKKEDNVLE